MATKALGYSKWDFAGTRIEGYAGTDAQGNALEDGFDGNNFVSSESILLLVTPNAKYSTDALNNAVAVGITQDIQFSQQRQAQQLFEVGSRRKYTFSSGRIQGNMGVSRMVFDGRSILKAFSNAPGVPDRDNAANAALAGNAAGAGGASAGNDTATLPANGKKLAGYGDFYINLGSSLFSKPVGIILIFKDISNQNVGAAFFQEAYVVSHSMNISSNSSFVGENISILFEGVFPVKHGTNVTASLE